MSHKPEFIFEIDKKYVGKSKYKHVYVYEKKDGTQIFRGYLPKKKWFYYSDNEREAALSVDKYLISKGLKPVNILKSVS